MSPAPSSGVGAGGFEAGDIVHLDFTPSAGREMRGPDCALVISRLAFNQASGIAWVCPISQGEAAAQRSGGFLVTLMGAGTRTLGSVQVHLLRGVVKLPPKTGDQEVGFVVDTWSAVFSLLA